MILLQLKIWFGPSRDAMRRERDGENRTPVRVDQESMATRMLLTEALRRVHLYESVFNDKYREVTAINITLLGVQRLEHDVPEDVLEVMRVRMVEELPRYVEEMQ